MVLKILLTKLTSNAGFPDLVYSCELDGSVTCDGLSDLFVAGRRGLRCPGGVFLPGDHVLSRTCFAGDPLL